MNWLDIAQKDIFEIKARLSANSEIRKLLYYNGSNALSGAEVLIGTISPYIYVSPVINTNVEPYNKNNFISIVLEQSEYDDEDSIQKGLLRINAISRTENWELDNNKVRPLAITSEIVDILNNIKLSSSHKITYISIEFIVINENLQGYTILLDLIDGGGLENEF